MRKREYMRLKFSSLTAIAAMLGLLALTGCSSGIQQGYTKGYAPKASRHNGAAEFPVHGIDVSKYQGDIDWSAVRGSGTQFAFIKATEGGDHADERFNANWNGAKAAGLARGAYHFAYWCRGAQEQAEWFTSHVPYEAEALPPVLDVEWITTSRTCPRKVPGWKAREMMQTMLNHMERTYGKRPVIYSTVDFYEEVLADGAFSDYPIWVRSTKYEPNVKYGSRSWHFWQYQSDGRVAGIRGDVDKNAFHGSHAQWLAFAGGGGAAPEEAPVQTASVTPPAPVALAAAPQPPAERIAVLQATDEAKTIMAKSAVTKSVLAPEPIARPYALASAQTRMPGAVAKLRPTALIPDAGEAAEAPLSLAPMALEPAAAQ